MDRIAIEAALNEWLVTGQPCVFGRVAARVGGIHYCILTDADIESTDEAIRDRIQTARAEWKSKAFAGMASAFVISVCSERVATAAPNDVLLEFSARLCQLYLLLETVEPDRIYLDHIELEIPRLGGGSTAVMFDAGVNLFAGAGDGRWWHDHRIPGGMAFSVNSVGHLAKSGELRRHLRDIGALVGEPIAAEESKLTSLGEALRWAMHTISSAADACSGPATLLLPTGTESRTPPPKCPIKLPRALADKNYCDYVGWYHTDVTIPSVYFTPGSERPDVASEQRLDFTYLFDDTLDNVAHYRMGKGVKVRGVAAADREHAVRHEATSDAVSKRGRAVGRPRAERPVR